MSENLKRRVEVDLDEIIELFLIIERLQQFFHQPLHYETLVQLNSFLGDRYSGAYAEMHQAYYEILWNWLPPDIQRQIEDR